MESIPNVNHEFRNQLIEISSDVTVHECDWIEEITGCVGLPLGALLAADAGAKAGRRRKARTVFSDQQLHGLERRFEKQRYLSTPERVELAHALHLSETQVTPTLSNCNAEESFRIVQNRLESFRIV